MNLRKPLDLGVCDACAKLTVLGPVHTYKDIVQTCSQILRIASPHHNLWSITIKTEISLAFNYRAWCERGFTMLKNLPCLSCVTMLLCAYEGVLGGCQGVTKLFLRCSCWCVAKVF